MPERITQRCGLLKQNLPAPWANKAAADEGSSVVCDTSMLLSIAGSEKVSSRLFFFYTPEMSNFSAISWREQVTFWWDDDFNVCFVLDQHG
jgi:hypothetical protein